jgi:predicted GNAT superfamily acetyltransferase
VGSVAQRTAEFITAVAPTLGFDPAKVQRVVIDADMLGGPVRVYVKGFAPEGAGGVVAGAADAVVVAEWPPGVPSETEMKILARQEQILAALERITPATNRSI